MALKAGSPGKGSRAQLTLVLVGRVAVIRYKVLVQPVSHTKYFIYSIFFFLLALQPIVGLYFAAL